MGTCSTPLFATVTPGKPEDYIILLSELSPEDIANWENSAFFITEDDDVNSFTLSDFMNTGSDCHKILFYFTQDKINMWVDLCKYISKKYKVITNIKFHFFCQDEQIPYYIEYQPQYNKLILSTGSSDSIYWFKINEQLSKPNSIRLTFDEESYKANWQQAIFSHQTLHIGFS
jgi:hypothetical protein